MKKIFSLLLLPLLATLCASQFAPAISLAQQQARPTSTPAPQEQTDEIVRITTELVQTDVSVFDKQGHFVDGLKKEDFELKVDGKPVEVSFFDRVLAGTVNEEAQLAAARGARPTSAVNKRETDIVKPLDRGRVVAFFIDDLHIDFDSLKRAKETITNYLENEMGQNDLVVIASASGQIGFLQQFTDNKAVLRAALERISYKNFDVKDPQRPIITPYQALLIDRGDRDINDYFVTATIQENPGISRDSAQNMVNNRALNILRQMAHTSTITLSTLESLARSAGQLPGRKLVFFISDGFFLDNRNSDSTERIRRITDASSRSGVVIYSLDAKGLTTGFPDASTDAPFDPSGRLMSAASGERSASQDIMNAVAADTGGRLIKNTNKLDTGLSNALKETSIYYLLAWRPEIGQYRAGKFRRIEVSIKNRPQLSVRVQRGFFEVAPEQKQKSTATATRAKTSDDPLRIAIGAQFPQSGLSTQLALSFIDTPKNGLLVSSMKIAGTEIKFEQTSGKPKATIEVEGVIIDAQGKVMDGFRERITATPEDEKSSTPKLPDIIYNYRSALKAGLYQVRVAARDNTSGQVGSATDWIEIPDLSKQQLSMSSLIVGERKPDAPAQGKKEETLIEGVPLSVDRRFSRSSRLRFLVYIYNATRGTTAEAVPDVALQVQVLRDNQPVITTPLRKVPTEEQDLARLAYAAEIPLARMTAGQYVLQVTAIDRISKTSTSRRVKFEVE